MVVKNNYNECLTNLACSIRKYFGLEYHHNTLTKIDDILDKYQPQNVIIILFDGMGSRILNRTLDSESFFIKNNLGEITSVFPPTTTAATTSIRTGLNPIEHGWLGWNMYIASIDKTITLFMNSEKGKKEKCSEFLEVKDKLVTKFIPDEINEIGTYKALSLFPFKTGNSKTYNDLDEMFNIIINETKQEEKKFIYAYNDEPDHTMHDYGPDSNKSIDLIKERNDKTKELFNKLEDTLLIVVADHGHIKTEHIFLNDYPEILNMLERTTSIEQRAVSFKIKKEYQEQFPKLFNQLFGEYFKLYNKQDIIDSRLFGDGVQNELFVSAIGDYLAIAYSNKCIVTDGDEVLVSNHAGYTDDEIYIPLIVASKKRKNIFN